MPREVELKLEIDRDSVREVTDAAGRMGAVAGTKNLQTVYFDTDDHRLYNAGLSLRVRHDGVRRIQTVKAVQGKSVGLYDRDEWESAIDSDTPVLATDGPIAEVLGSKETDRIKPIFHSSIDRAMAHVTANDYEIELVVDQGEITAGDKMSPVLEVELELKRGAPANLFALARTLDAAAAVRLGVLTKAERGYRLLGRLSSGAARAEPVGLEPTMTAATAFQTIAWSCVRHFRLNETASVQDPAALHQARVALRRLRSRCRCSNPSWRMAASSFCARNCAGFLRYSAKRETLMS